MKWTAQQRVPLKNYTKWNKLLEVVTWWETNFYNKIKEFGEGMLGIHWSWYLMRLTDLQIRFAI